MSGTPGCNFYKQYKGNYYKNVGNVQCKFEKCHVWKLGLSELRNHVKNVHGSPQCIYCNRNDFLSISGKVEPTYNNSINQRITYFHHESYRIYLKVDFRCKLDSFACYENSNAIPICCHLSSHNITGSPRLIWVLFEGRWHQLFYNELAYLSFYFDRKSTTVRMIWLQTIFCKLLLIG